jgi:two-component system sensor histidine kinase KdpD
VLEEGDRLKSSMLAAVSHDLRTPLAAIKASASTLRDTSVEWPPDVREELLGAIEEETDRLTLMVSNLLDLSRIEGGALRPDRGWNDVSELVHDVERQVRLRLGERRLSVTVPDEVPLVSFDYVEIAQVLLNLVGNAITYSNDGTEIVISIEVREDEVEIAVRDEGMGIPPGELPFVFDPFVRGHDQAPATGSGIGLAICKGLVEAHGGRIRAESEPGVGTIMRFTLPRKDPE